MMTDFDNLDVTIGNENINSLDRELANAFEQSSVQGDTESNMYQRNEHGNFTCENCFSRQNDVIESFETFANELNLRLSQEMDSVVALMHTRINRAISTAISEKVTPEIQIIVSSMSSSGNRDTEASMSPNSQVNTEVENYLKNDSRSACNLKDTTGRGSYMVTEATETQRQIPEFLKGPMHSIPNLERQQSTHKVSQDTILPAPEPEVPETSSDPLIRLADVLVDLQNKPQSMTIRPFTTTPMTFDGNSAKFELSEDLFHTKLKMQPAMTEPMNKIHFQSLLRKGSLHTVRNINSTTAKQ